MGRPSVSLSSASSKLSPWLLFEASPAFVDKFNDFFDANALNYYISTGDHVDKFNDFFDANAQFHAFNVEWRTLATFDFQNESLAIRALNADFAFAPRLFQTRRQIGLRLGNCLHHLDSLILIVIVARDLLLSLRSASSKSSTLGSQLSFDTSPWLLCQTRSAFVDESDNFVGGKT